MTVNVITPPTSEPVSLAELKTFARITSDVDNALVTSLGIAAREFVETATGRQLMTATLELVLPHFPADALSLPRGPVQSIESVKVIDRDDTERTLVLGTDYRIDLDTFPANVAPVRRWPSIGLRSNAVRVRYVAGYGDAQAVPASLKTVICALASWWYEQREPGVIGVSTAEAPFHVKRLLNANRDWSAA